MIIFTPRHLRVELLPIGPLITSVAAATPGSFSAADPAAAPHLDKRPPRSPFTAAPGSAPLLSSLLSSTFAPPVGPLRAETLTCKASAEVHWLEYGCRYHVLA